MFNNVDKRLPVSRFAPQVLKYRTLKDGCCQSDCLRNRFILITQPLSPAAKTILLQQGQSDGPPRRLILPSSINEICSRQNDQNTAKKRKKKKNSRLFSSTASFRFFCFVFLNEFSLCLILEIVSQNQINSILLKFTFCSQKCVVGVSSDLPLGPN